MTVRELIDRLARFPKNREVFLARGSEVAAVRYVHSGMVAGEPPVRVTSGTYPMPGPMTMCVLIGEKADGP